MTHGSTPNSVGYWKKILKFMANNSWGLIFFIEIRWWHELEKLGAAGRARKKYWLWKFTASKNPNGPPFWLLCTYLPESKMRLHNRRQNVQTAAKNKEAWISNFPQIWIFGTRMYQYWANWCENETLICAFHITNTEALCDSRFFFRALVPHFIFAIFNSFIFTYPTHHHSWKSPFKFSGFRANSTRRSVCGLWPVWVRPSSAGHAFGFNSYSPFLPHPLFQGITCFSHVRNRMRIRYL